MRIWFDCDGVLADFTSKYLDTFEVLHGRRVRYEDVRAFRYSDAEHGICTRDEDNAVWDFIDRTPGWVRTIPTIADGLELLRDIREYSSLVIQIGCLTSPHSGPTWAYERERFLLSLGFTKKEIVQADAKGNVLGDLLLDDKPENCIDFLDSNPGARAILLTQPWNARYDHFEAKDVHGNSYALEARLIRVYNYFGAAEMMKQCIKAHYLDRAKAVVR